MVRSSTKLVSRAVISAALAFPVAVSGLAYGQDAAAPAAVSLAPIPKEVRKLADDYWHYVSIARYELAAGAVKQLAESNTDPIVVLRAFEAVAADRKQDLDRNLARWSSLEGTKDSAKQLSELLDKGRLALAADQAYIEDNIKRLIVNERAYQLAVARLRQSGELAVPLMVQYLRAPEHVQYHGSIRRALTDMGKTALSPLLAATEMKDARVLTTIALILGDMGYDPAVPYLLRLSASPDVASSVRAAAGESLRKLNVSGSTGPSDAFYQLAERFYYDNAMITADLSQAPMAFVWYWSEDRGLTKREVAPAIFNEIMAMRAAEYALAADQGKAEAVSLWLASNFKREVELPSGATDATRAEGQPSGHYYGVAAGARYLNDVLTRSLRDRNSAVALKAVKALQEIVGQSSLFSGGTTPLTAALGYPDKVVRFESAYAVGSSMPAPFSGAEQVVPILAEGVAQTGMPGVVVVAANTEAANKLVEELKGQGYNAVAATSAAGAVNQATTIPAIDAIVVAEDAGLAVVDGVLAASGSSPKLGRTPKVLVTKTAQSIYASRAATDVLVNLTQSTEPAALKDAIDKARARSGSNPLDAAAATDVAIRSLTLLKNLAMAKSPAFDLVTARPTLIAALDDSRPEVAMLAGEVLAWMGQREGQVAIATKVTDSKTTDALRLSLLKSLSGSAKVFGNQLAASSVEGLEQLVTGGSTPEIKNAAAEARGALNLPPDQAKALILQQSQK